MGRDPIAAPLDEMELELFWAAIVEVTEAEFTPNENGKVVEVSVDE